MCYIVCIFVEFVSITWVITDIWIMSIYVENGLIVIICKWVWVYEKYVLKLVIICR
jgi:hypothetical protein